MRHSTITLTMDTYGHLVPGQEADAVGRLPHMGSGEERESLRATGTTYPHAERPTDPHPYPRQLERETVRTGATRCQDSGIIPKDGSAPKPLRNKGKRDAMRRSANPNKNAPPGTRTPDPLIKSQLLCQTELAVPQRLPSLPWRRGNVKASKR